MWSLDPEVTFLNHGSFGAVPVAIQEAQSELLRRMDRQPVDFFVRYLPKAAAAVRERIGEFIGADPDGIAFVNNATGGVNTVVKSLDFEPGDELLTFDHAYGACRATLDHVAAKSGARVVVAHVPFPIGSADEMFDAIVSCATDRTKLAMIDHITSPTGLVFPIQRIVEALHERGIDTVVDGAHAIGQVPLDLDAIGAAYYTTNAHKWLCTPRGAALLYVRKDRRDRIRPLTTSHGYGSPPDVRFRAEFDWTGTDDPTAHLVIPDAIDHLGQAVDGGWPGLYAAIHTRAVEGRNILCDALQLEPPAPDDLFGSLAAMILPDGDGPVDFMLDPLSAELWEQHRIEVPIFPWPAAPKRMLRISAHLYNHAEHYRRLANALAPLLPKT